MPRLLLVERDATRRDALYFVLMQAGFDIAVVEAHQTSDHISSRDLLILGDGDLTLLGDLRRTAGRLPITVLALIDPGNCDGILECLAAGVAGVVSRRRTNDEIVAKIHSLLSTASEISEGLDEVPSDEKSLSTGHVHRKSDLIAALKAACEDIGQLQEQY